MNTPEVGAALVLYDGIDNSGKVIGTFPLTAQVPVFNSLVGLAFATGLYAVTSRRVPGRHHRDLLLIAVPP